MFKVSRRLDYGLQLMIALASEPENHPVPSATLAEKLHIPLPFLHQIGHMLMQAGLVKASPGPRGGLRLNQSPETITVLKIVETLEGPVCMNDCLACGQSCVRQEGCTAFPMWDRLQQNITNFLGKVLVSSLVNTPVELPFYSLTMPEPVSKIKKENN
jgi:Rrf2 family protein